ncbi:MAG: glycine cleavage system aminomethyltransferase GcvT [Bacteroidales bacterium]
MKTTVFTDLHVKLGAKMEPFAGYNMPVQYEGIMVEHNNVREKVGVFDVSHMGEFWVKGPKAFDLVQKITTNDVAALSDGKVQYTCMPNGRGGIVDDMLVYRINAETYMLVPNAANIDKDWAWCSKYAQQMGMEVGKELYNASDEISQLAVQGPLALTTIQKLTDTPILDMEYYTFKKVNLAGVPDVILSTTGYTGAGGCELYFANQDGLKIWNAVFDAGKEYGIKPCGLGCRDTLRLEMGFCLYGHEITEETSPIEAGLGWITKMVDGNDFVDREKMELLKAEGVKRKLVGFEMIDRGIPRPAYEICDVQGNKIGTVCSGSQAPSLSKAIGTGYVKSEFSKKDTEIYIKIREKLIKAVVVRMPFYKK